jgi:HNH endonuclease/NUMOD4 motif
VPKKVRINDGVKWGSVPINGFEHYIISSDGQVFNLKTRKIVEGSPNAQGYIRVKLCNKGRKRDFYVHRLVAFVHIPNHGKNPEIHHKDHDRKNNKKSNLEWVDHSENMDYNRQKNHAESKHLTDIHEDDFWATEVGETEENDLPF